MLEKTIAYVHMSIHNIFGQLVSSSSYYDTDHLRFFLEASPGTYFVTLDDSGEERYVFKVVKW